jgi:hypothetical protein
MQSYVVTLHAFDDELDTTPFQVGSSLAASCAVPLGFQDVIIAGQIYIAEIDGYEASPEQLVPVFGQSSGARQMVDADSGDSVAPRWTTRCGHGASDGVTASTDVQRFISPCDPLVDAASSATRVAIDPARVVGSGGCALADSFDMMSLEGGLGDQLAIACDGEPVVLPATAGQIYRYHAQLISEGVAHGASCSALAVSGQQLAFTCDPLVTTGAIQLDLAGLADDDGPACPSGSLYQIGHAGDDLGTLPASCGSQTHVDGLDPGIYLLDVVVFDALAAPSGKVISCAADVQAGRTVDASCVL